MSSLDRTVGLVGEVDDGLLLMVLLLRAGRRGCSSLFHLHIEKLVKKHNFGVVSGLCLVIIPPTIPSGSSVFSDLSQQNVALGPQPAQLLLLSLCR